MFFQLVCGLAVCAGVLRADDATLEQARQLVNEAHRYDQAEQVYRSMLDGPERARAAAELGALLESLGDIDGAVVAYEQAVAIGGFDDNTAQRLESSLDHCRRQRGSRVRFPVSLEALTDIRQIETALDGQQWVPAFNNIASMLDRYEGTFLQQGDDQYLGVWRWAQQRLTDLTEPGRAAYQAWSAPAWQTTIDNGSPGAFRQFALDFPEPTRLDQTLSAWAGVCTLMGDDKLAADVAPGPVPAVAASQDEPLVRYDGESVNAFNPADGKWLWRYQPLEPLRRRNVRRSKYGRERRPRWEWAGLPDEPAVLVCPAGVLVVQRYEDGDVEEPRAVLTCLDAATGQVHWQSDRNPHLAKRRVCSAPVYTGGMVLAAVRSGGNFPEYWLCAFNARDGALLWELRVAVGATPTQCVGRGLLYAGQSGPTVGVDGDVVYYATHMGAVLAVDRILGQPLWAVTYPRIARFGPLTRYPLPLLERRTEPMRVSGDDLVVMPRDFNGVLVIDRRQGALARVIRSLELTRLIDVADRQVVVGTVNGEVRCYGLDNGDLQACADRPTDTRSDVTLEEPPAPDLPMARTMPDDTPEGWHYEAAFPGPSVEAGWVGPGNDPLLIVTGGQGLSAFTPNDGYSRRWWSPFDHEHGVWAAGGDATAGERRYVVVSNDGRALRVLNADTGDVVSAIEACDIEPIRRLFVIGDTVIAVGTSTMQGLAAGDLRQRWFRDFSPRVFEQFFTADAELAVIVQPGGGWPGEFIRINPISGEPREGLTLIAPLPEWLPYQESNRPGRYPVQRLAFKQDQVRHDDGGWFVEEGGKRVDLYPSPVRFADRTDGMLVLEIADYWLLVNETTGDTVMMTPFEMRRASREPDGPYRRLADWLSRHPRHERYETPDFEFEADGVRFAKVPCEMGDDLERRHCGQLETEDGRILPLGGMIPTGVDRIGDRLLFRGDEGVVVISRVPPSRGPEKPGKATSDLFLAPGIVPAASDGIVLDGDVSDWPEDAWHELTFARNGELGLNTGETHESDEAAFAWAMDADAVWLAVRVRDDTLTDAGTSFASCGDFVDVMLTGFVRRDNRNRAPDSILTTVRLRLACARGLPLVHLFFTSAQHLPLAHVHSAENDYLVGRTVGADGLFDHWLDYHFGSGLERTDRVVVGGLCGDQSATWELRVARSLFDDRHVGGFDIAVSDDDGAGVKNRRTWAGALYDADMFPVAPFLPASAGGSEP